MFYLNTRSRLPNAGMDACPSPQMSKPFVFLTYPFLWVLATFRPANQQDACTVRVRMMFFIITFWKTCFKCKKRLKLDCSAHPETLPAGPENIKRSTHTYVSLLKPASFQHSVLWSAGKKGLGILLLNCQCPWRHFPCISAGALALKMNRNVCIWFWMQQVFSQEVNFREIKRKYFMVQITQDSFTYCTLHIDMVVL